MKEQARQIEQFRTHLIRLGYRKSSINMLPNCVTEFFVFSEKSAYQIRKADIEAYQEYLQERPNKRREGGLSSAYIQHHIYSLKTFFAWLQESGQLKANPISGMQFDAPKSKVREILTVEEVKQLYAVSTSYRERAILSIFYGCGLRRSEGVALNLRDIHFRSNLLYVRSGKYGKRRAVPMGEKVKADLWNYVLEERFCQPTETALICGQSGMRLQGDGLGKVLKKIIKRTKIEKSISLHSLRHSIATHLLENGLSVEYVRDFLGHKQLESTQIYTRINSKQLWNLNST